MTSPNPARKRGLQQCDTLKDESRLSLNTSEEYYPYGEELSFETTVRGSRHYDTNSLVENSELLCVREPTNPADNNAIALYTSSPEHPSKIGYFSRHLAATLAPVIDRNQISLRAIIQSKSSDIKIRVFIDGTVGSDLIKSIQSGPPVKKSAFVNRVLCENLDLLLESVQFQNDHLLSSIERNTYLQLRHLIPDVKALLLRLYLRKGKWFRVQRIDYFEPTLTEVYIRQLVEKEFLEVSITEGILFTMTVENMKDCLRKFRTRDQSIRIAGKKQKLSEELKRAVKNHSCLLQALHADYGETVRVHPRLKECLRVAERLYFLDDNRNLSSFLTLELDIVRWPQFQVKAQTPVFPDRLSFEDYFAATQQLAEIEQWAQSGSKREINEALEAVWRRLEAGDHKKLRWSSIEVSPSGGLPIFLARYTSIWIQVKTATVGIAFLEKEKRYKEAIEKLRCLLGGNCCPSSRGLWWNRLVIDLEHLKKFNAALETCTSALADNWVRHGDRHSIKRRLLKLSKPPRRWKLPSWAPQVNKPIKIVKINAKPLDSVPGCKSQFLLEDGVGSVEDLALEYYVESGGWKGFHTEGSLWSTIFGVLFWNVIFSDPGEVFRSPFQDAPLDFGTDWFYESRRDQIEECLLQIRHGDAIGLFKENWKEQVGVNCRGVQWDRYSDLDELLEILDCIGPARLSSISRLFAEDFYSVRGGLPDLFLWKGDQKVCKLSEVKGPRDTLSDKQRAWIGVLTEIGFDTEVLTVEN